MNNCTINSTIENKGRIIIDDNTVFCENAKITGTGEIVINDITKILPIIDTINGNYVINDTTLNKSYTFNGKVTLNNCTTNNPDNINFGSLTLNNCSIDVGEDNIFLDNFGTVFVNKDTELVGKINDLGGETTYDGRAKTYVVNNRTLSIFFEGGKIASIVNPGDILDFQGTITPNSGVGRLVIDKPINIISTTNDGKIDGFSVINYTSGASGSNITGLYTHNTQFYVWGADHIVFDNISNVVEDQKIGWGVGQSSIRENSSYITVKNSYFYTKDNGGSSTLVLAWANYCTIENNTIEGDGMVGNLLYLTTYNVKIPNGAIFNSHNRLYNNTIRGPQEAAAICYGICISGYDNLVSENTINYSGSGIMFQWGSGVDGIENEESLFGSGENIVSNNKLYGGCGISAGNIICNNYLEEGILTVSDAIAYNNTMKSLTVGGNITEISNNTIKNGITVSAKERPYSLIANNTIGGNIKITNSETPNNVILTENNITGSITLDGSGNTITNNNITTTDEYTISSKKLNSANNIITDNYLLAAYYGGDDSVSLKDASNIIENNTPINTRISLTAQSETTVNTTTPITIILTTKNGELIKGEEVTITGNNVNDTVMLENGVLIYQYTPTAMGEDTITVTFPGNKDYAQSTNQTTITVTVNKDEVIEQLNNTVQEQNQTINSQEETIKQQETSIETLNNTTQTQEDKITEQEKETQAQQQTIKDQQATIDAQAKQIEQLQKEIEELKKQNQTTPTTTKKATTITYTTIKTASKGSTVKITGKLLSDNKAVANQKVTVTVNSKTYTVTTTSTGAFTVNYKVPDYKDQKVTYTYNGNSDYKASKNTTTFSVTQPTTLKIYKIKIPKKGSTIKVSGKLLDANGKGVKGQTITININGKTYTAKTYSSGYFTIQYKVDSYDKRTLTFTYKGSTLYKASKASTKFNVYKETKITTYKMKTAKKGTAMKVSGKLLDINGKGVRARTVTIKINKKTYTAKTLNSGYFTVQYTPTTVGTNNVTFTFSGGALYKTSTNSTSFKVKA